MTLFIFNKHLFVFEVVEVSSKLELLKKQPLPAFTPQHYTLYVYILFVWLIEEGSLANWKGV